MKKLLSVFALLLQLVRWPRTGPATSWIRTVQARRRCGATKPAPQSCIKRGAPAVFVTEDGKIYKIADQDKVKADAGKKVTITGKMDGDTITVDSVKANVDSVQCEVPPARAGRNLRLYSAPTISSHFLHQVRGAGGIAVQFGAGRSAFLARPRRSSG